MDIAASHLLLINLCCTYLHDVGSDFVTELSIERPLIGIGCWFVMQAVLCDGRLKLDLTHAFQ